MSNKIEDKSVHDILMCVIGEALMKADASFMFGYDFSDIINKYGPLLQHKTSTTENINICEGDSVYILLIKLKLEPFGPLSYIDEVCYNKVDIWNRIELLFNRFLNDWEQDITDIEINRYGVVIRLIDINGEDNDYILYEIHKRTIS